MRKFGMFFAGALIAVVMAAPQAGAAPTDRTQVHDVTVVTPGSTNPCNGVVGTQTITFHMVSHTNITPSMQYHYTFNQNGTVSYVPDDPTLLSFSGTFHVTNTVNGPEFTPGGNYTFIETVNGQFSDGTPGTLLIHEHLTVNANGVVTATINSGVTCG